MSGIGFWELIILFLIGLIVLGPQRLPRVANQIGGWLGQARRMTRVMKRQLEEELNLEEELSIKPYTSTPASPVKKPVEQPPADTSKDPDFSAVDVEGNPLPESGTGEELDDTYSPAHAPDAPGTGVADDEEHDLEDTDEVRVLDPGDDTDDTTGDHKKLEEPSQ